MQGDEDDDVHGGNEDHDVQGDGLHGDVRDGVQGDDRDGLDDNDEVKADDMQGDDEGGVQDDEDGDVQGDGVRDGVQGDDQCDGDRDDDEVHGDGLHGDDVRDGVHGADQCDNDEVKAGGIQGVQDEDKGGVQVDEDDDVLGRNEDLDVHGTGDATDVTESQDCRSTMAVQLKETYRTVDRKDTVIQEFKQNINNKHTGVLEMVKLFEQISSGIELNTCSSSTSIREEMEFGLGGLKEKFRKRNTRGYHLRESAEEETNFV